MLAILTDALYNVVFIVIMYEVWIYFQHFVFVFSLLFWGNKLLSFILSSWITLTDTAEYRFRTYHFICLNTVHSGVGDDLYQTSRGGDVWWRSIL